MNDSLPLVIANLKANKTWDDISAWLDAVSPQANNFPGTVIFCPSSPFLVASFQKIKADNLKIKLGSQDISQFGLGPITGEFAASQVKDIIDYAIIGHSERRAKLNETDDILEKKVKQAQEAQIAPIFCVQDEKPGIPQGVKIIAYEPTFAIGTGNSDTPENAKSVSQKLKEEGDYIVLYGGSVTSKNVSSFLEKNKLDGVLVGSASLEPQEFIGIIESAEY